MNRAFTEYELAPRPIEQPDCVAGTYTPLVQAEHHVQPNGVEYWDIRPARD